MVRDEAVFEQVRRMTTERSMAFNALNQAQADVPEGCTVLPNRLGTAPGMLFEREVAGGGRKLVFSLPGVPFEMKALVEEQVIPQIRRHFALRAVVGQVVCRHKFLYQTDDREGLQRIYL